MSQKVEKPTLTGQRIKTRKRDEKEKYDPSAFRDTIVQGLTEAHGDIEQVSKFLDSAGSRLDYRRYAEPLLDILFAGGILAPGGSLQQDAGAENGVARCTFCVFAAADDPTTLRSHYEVLFKLLRRYKYLEKSFEEELAKLIKFLKGFNADERIKLAKVVGYCLANGVGSSSCISSLFEEHLVKDGLSVDFARAMFQVWLLEKDIQNISAALKRAGLESKLMELLPINKRTMENFENSFRMPELQPIVEFQRSKASAEVKKGVQSKLEEMIRNEDLVKEMVVFIKEHMTKSGMQDHEVVVLVWNTLMNAVEWSKKEELVADQALKHLQQYGGVLAAVTGSGRAQLILINKVQDYCYENMNFLKAFAKIIQLFYRADVLSEDAILKWHSDGKGKGVLVEQLKPFVEWLKQAEEESGDED
jgi:heme-degrading monooxygenase HmoA